MSAVSLERALRAHGLDGVVEARGGLAVLIPRESASDFAMSERRDLALRLAREHGFTHLAVELAPARDGA